MADFTASAVDLDAIRERCDAATEGPWALSLGPHDSRVIVGQHYLWRAEGARTRGQDVADAQLIAAARRDIPALLSLVDRLEAELGETRERLTKQAAVTSRLHNVLVRLAGFSPHTIGSEAMALVRSALAPTDTKEKR